MKGKLEQSGLELSRFCCVTVTGTPQKYSDVREKLKVTNIAEEM